MPQSENKSSLPKGDGAVSAKNNANEDKSQFISLAEASQILKSSRHIVFNHIKSGNLQQYNVGKRTLLKRSEVVALLNYQPVVRKNHVIAIANQKGGVGKTTTVINMAAALSYRGRKVLVIDCDPQANLTQTVLRDGKIHKTVYDIFTQNYQHVDELIHQVRENFDVLPSNIELSKAEQFINDFNKFYSLSDFIAKLGDRYDFTIIDTPPALSIFTTASLLAATHVIIPIQLNIFSLQGLNDLIHTIQQIRIRNDKLSILGFLGCFYDKRNKLCEQVLEHVHDIGQEVFKTLIHRNVRLEEQPAYNFDIFQYDINSTGSDDYNFLTNELLERMEALEKSK